MRVPSVIKGLKNSQKIYLVVNGVAMFTTVAATDKFAYSTQRSAVYVLLSELAQSNAKGMSRTVRVYNDKMEQVPVEVSVSLCLPLDKFTAGAL